MPNVLVVDDEIQNLNAICRDLRERSPDWNIYSAANQADALAIANETTMDVVITDLVMATDQSGIDVLRQVKTKDPLTMVILITAFEKRLDRYRAFDLGAYDCIQKNMPGVVAAEEIFVKAQAALRLRNLALQQLADQRRIGFLGRYFDPRVFGLLTENPQLLNIRTDTLTICFWDIRGFSLLSESLKTQPTLVAGFLKEYFEIAAKAIFEHGGILDKFIGDGVMGLFGAVVPLADSVQQGAISAVAAAADLRRDFANLLRNWEERWTLCSPQTIDIGLACGVHTGEVLVGNVGAEFRDQYTALGPSVNFAQRVEAHAGKGEILLSASTEIRVRDKFELEEACSIDNVKNIPGTFKLYRVARQK